MRLRSVLVSVFVLVALVASCSRGTELAVVDSDAIPSTIREFAEGRPAVSNLVWRAYYEQDGYLIAVNTHRTGTTDRAREDMVQWLVYQETDNGVVLVMSDDYRWGSKVYSWVPQATPSVIREDTYTYNVYASGSALAKAAHRVVGTTSRGQVLEGRVVNGFWLLLMTNHPGGETFETVVVEDSQGKVLHTNR